VSIKYGGESDVYITGFEAGAHALWSIVFNHPEILKAAAPVCGNFRGRCTGKISADQSKENLPIHSLRAGKEIANGPPMKILDEQWNDAKTLAQSNGYKNLSQEVFPSKSHEPMPEEVLAYFTGLIERK
jgi:hypothetical protein